MPAELRGGIDRIVAHEQAAAHREPGIAHHVGITGYPRKAAPVGQFELPFRAIDDCFSERDGKRYRRAQQLIVVSKVIDIAAKIVGVEAKLAEETLSRSNLKIISV